MDRKLFFTTDNKSGSKTKESFIKVNHPEIYGELHEFVTTNNLNNLSFKEQIWHFANSIKETPLCAGCGNSVRFKGTITKGYSDYCSLSCANTNGNLSGLAKKSIYEKYGVESTNQLDSVKQKKKDAYMDKFGVDNPMKDQKIRNKQSSTLKRNHGVDNPMYSDEIKEKHRDTIQNKYQVDNIFQHTLVKNLIIGKHLKNLGVSYPTQSEVVKNKIRVVAEKKLKDKFPFILAISDDILSCVCDNCSEEYTISRILLNERNRDGYGLCTVCNPVGSYAKSRAETDIYDLLVSLGFVCERKNRSILGGKELDIYIPSHNIAIEFDGLYWHSEVMVGKNYHLNKTEVCESAGIKLIHIFEDEWLYKKDIVISRLKHILGITGSRVYARKCEIREVGVSESKQFLIDNHIQGNVKSKHRVGLYYNNDLVSLMTFGNGRVIMGGDSSTFELLRFCNKIDTTVVGGASRLLKYFIDAYKPKEIISYADRRWSQGGLYESIGFNFAHNSKPNYWYINGTVREYRFKYRKSELVRIGFDKNKSEHEIMLSLKKYRIYDCGARKFSLRL